MKIKAYAKVNLILDVNEKLKTGYHDISFFMTTLNLYDEVEVKRSEFDRIEVVNNKQLSNENNLAFKALQLIKSKYNINTNYEIIVKKNIPVAAGMAGGSTDAAAVINAINKIEKLNLSNEQLIDLGIKIGADVPFCIFSSLAIVKGIGEQVEVINKNIPDTNVLVINSGEELSTKEVYDNHLIEDIKGEDISNILKEKDYQNFYSQLRNSLQKTSFKLMPQVKELHDEIINSFDVTKVLISGSGPTILVFDEKLSTLKKIKQRYNKRYEHVEIYKVNKN